MENIESYLHNTRETLYTSPSSRLMSGRPRNGVFEDLGSGFGRNKSKASEKSINLRKSKLGSSSGGSEDELDCLSQNSNDGRTAREIQKPRKGEIQSSYDPEVLAKKDHVLNNMKFKKNKSVRDDDEHRKASPSATAKVIARTSSFKTSKDEVKRNAKAQSSTQARGSSPVIAITTARTKPRPKARMIPPPSPSQEEDMAEPPSSNPKNSLARMPTEFPMISPLSKSQGNLPDITANNTITRTASAFPVSPLSKNTARNASLSLSRLVGSPEITPNNPGTRKTFAFPVSPLSKNTTRSAPTSSETNLTPSSSVVEAHKKTRTKPKEVKGKQKFPQLEPFPMSTQEMGVISSSSKDQPDSMDLYEEEDSLFMAPGIDPRMLCPYCDSPLPTSPTPLFQDLLKATFEKSIPDPRSTNPLGRKASLSIFVSVCQRHEFESEILPEAEAKGWPKAINWESLGDRIVEMRPELEKIIRDSSKADLSLLAKNLEAGGVEDLATSYTGKGPRMRCVFWREAMESVLRRGVRVTEGVNGQFLDFEKSQPGYYGELGSMIIQQTLFTLFPLDSFDPKLIAPFTSNDFIQRILVPEVALRLIMEDRGLEGPESTEAALLVLRDSTTYGVAMFPEDTSWNVGATRIGSKKGVDGVAMGIGDRIVMERARKRRKELERGGDIEAVSGREGGRHGRDGDSPVRTRNGNDPCEITKDVGLHCMDIDLGESEPSRMASKKKSIVHHDDDVVSINSVPDGNETEVSLRSTRSSTRSTLQRSTKSLKNPGTVNNTDQDWFGKKFCSSQDQYPSLKPRSTRPRSTAPSPTPSRSPSASKRQGNECPSGSKRKRTIRPSQRGINSIASSPTSPDIEICSTDDISDDRGRKGTRRADPRPKTPTGSTRRRQRSQSTDRGLSPAKVVDPDMNTPIPKRSYTQARKGTGGDDSTPRPLSRNRSVTTPYHSQPKQQTVLALARTRAQNHPEDASGIGSDEHKKATVKLLQSNPWKHDFRSDLADGLGNSSDVEVKEDFSWLLSESESEEI